MNLKNIKSWYFSLAAVFIQAIFLVYWFWFIDFTPPRIDDDLTSVQGVPFLFALFSLVILVALLVPTILLKINNFKTKKVGAFLSLLFGTIAGLYLIVLLKNYFVYSRIVDSYIVIFLFQAVQVFLLFAAGLSIFSKKETPATP